MNLEYLRELLGIKVYLEFDNFKKGMLKEEPKEIFNQAYKVDCYINFYEHLIGMSERLGEDEIKSVIFFPSFLAFLFEEWIKRPELGSNDMYEFISEEIQKQTREYLKEVA